MPPSSKDPRFRWMDAAGQNGGVPPVALAGEYLTPAERLFVRSHAAVPQIDATTWHLTLDGLFDRPLVLSLDQLLRFQHRTVNATLICAGLRRRELLSVGPLPGELPWAGESVGTPRWGGVSLVDVLESAGVPPTCRHVEFTGLDQVERLGEQFGFGASIPIDKARDKDVLLAFELDGKPLSPAHGFPVRLVVPGWIGAQSVKWLSRIRGSETPTANYFRTRAYRVQRTASPGNPQDVTAGSPIEEIALNSMILTPEAGSRCRAGTTDIAGWAIGPNAEPPSRVEVSSDGGVTWVNAALQAEADRWTWRHWHATLRLIPGSHELAVRAWDHAGRVQPALITETWNVKGYVNNAWHRVPITATV